MLDVPAIVTCADSSVRGAWARAGAAKPAAAIAVTRAVRMKERYEVVMPNRWATEVPGGNLRIRSDFVRSAALDGRGGLGTFSRPREVFPGGVLRRLRA